MKLATPFIPVLLLLTACNIDVHVTGKGTVTSNPTWISCRDSGGVCKVKNYERLDIEVEDLIVTFKATPDAHHRLKSWSGDCVETVANKCRVKLGEDVDVKAAFLPLIYQDNELENSQTVNFIAMGDMGTAASGQYDVADGISRWCQSHPCDFILGMGDNFYSVTPSSPYDDVFESHFEMPYANVDQPFYMVLGNHDTGRMTDGDSGDQAKGEAQVAYSQRTDRTSNKWHMPARYYQFSAGSQAGTAPLVDFFALDSAPLVGAYDPNPKYRVGEYAEQQGRWLQQQLQSSSAHWRFAFAHHPYVSNGKHGNASNYDGSVVGDTLVMEKLNGEIFRRFMEKNVCGKVDWFLSGHDHNMQVLAPVAPCGTTQFVVSGAGAKANTLANASDNQVYLQQGNRIGFTYISIHKNQMDVRLVSSDQGIPKLIASQRFTKILRER